MPSPAPRSMPGSRPATRRGPPLDGTEGGRAIASVVNFILLTMLAVDTVAMVRVRNLFAVAVLTSVYSFLIATVLLVLDAPDVALTEAAVGAGVGTVLIVGALYLTKTDEARPVHSILLPLFVAGGTAAVLLFGASETPPFGDPANPVHAHGAGLHRPLGAGDRHPQRRLLGAGELPRLRHARRDAGDLHRRHRDPDAAEASASRSGRTAADMRLDLILRVATKLILPFMLLFALYVQFHGDYGAGGGFQAGTIAGAGVILYALVFGLRRPSGSCGRRWSRPWSRSACSSMPRSVSPAG